MRRSKTQSSFIRSKVMLKSVSREVFRTDGALARRWRFCERHTPTFEEQVSPTNSFLRHVTEGRDKLDWLEKLKSTRVRDYLTLLATVGKMRFQALKLRFRLSFPFECSFYTTRGNSAFSFWWKNMRPPPGNDFLLFFVLRANVRLLATSLVRAPTIVLQSARQEKYRRKREKRESQLLVKLSLKYQGDSRTREDKNNFHCRLQTVLNRSIWIRQEEIHFLWHFITFRKWIRILEKHWNN